jgi:hypothetical protein
VHKLEQDSMSKPAARAFVLRAVRVVAALAALTLLVPHGVSAQPGGDDWQVSLAPLYLSIARTDGQLTAGTRTVPVFMDFKDTASNLSAAFSFHFEGGKGRWGLASDLNYMGLSTDTTVTVLGQPVDAAFSFDQTVFEVAGSYTVNPKAGFAIISGLRTLTFAPTLSFTRNQTLEPVDNSRTSANFFGGFTYRPRLSDKVSLISRADIGGGDAHLTWSAAIGAEYRFKPWGGLVVAYRGLGIDASQEQTDETINTGFDMTYYGPTFGLNFHWGKQ